MSREELKEAPQLKEMGKSMTVLRDTDVAGQRGKVLEFGCFQSERQKG